MKGGMREWPPLCRAGQNEKKTDSVGAESDTRGKVQGLTGLCRVLEREADK